VERTKLHETKNIGLSLKGKRIVILGGRSELGFATARAASREDPDPQYHHWFNEKEVAHSALFHRVRPPLSTSRGVILREYFY
jgi:hypothetical protein